MLSAIFIICEFILAGLAIVAIENSIKAELRKCGVHYPEILAMKICAVPVILIFLFALAWTNFPDFVSSAVIAHYFLCFSGGALVAVFINAGG